MDISVLKQHIQVLLREQKFSELADVCRLIISNVHQCSPEDSYHYSLLAAFALYRQNQHKESYELLLPLHRCGYQEIDVLFLLTANSLAQGDYEKAISFGEEFLQKVNSLKSKQEYSGFMNALSSVHEICNNLGAACVKLKQDEKAIEFFSEGLKFHKEYSIVYENLATVYYRLERWEDAKSIVEEGLRHIEKSAGLYRIYGSVLQKVHKYGKALQAFEIAIGLGEKEAVPEIASLYQKMSKFKDAARWLEHYFASDQSILQDRSLLDAVRNSHYYHREEPKISAALIVKNEEDLLGQCLESIIDAVDEIVVVDTGSEDKTVEIAEHYGAKVYYHPWRDDFSEARNVSIAKATGEWILIIDADEVLVESDILKVREFKWTEEYDCFCFAVYSQLPGQLGGINQGKHYSPRMFKKRKDIYYEGIVHNVLRIPPKTGMTDIGILHYGYDLRKEKMVQKFQRSLALLLKQVDALPQDPFVRFNLAQMYLSRDYFNEAEEHAEEILKILTPDNTNQIHIYLMALYQLVIIQMRQKDYKRAEEYCMKALAVKANYVDPLLSLGWIYFYTDRYDESVRILTRFLDVCNELRDKNEYHMIILNKAASDFEAYYVLGEIFRRKRNNGDARQNLEKSIERNPYYWLPCKSLGIICAEEGDDDAAEYFFEQAIKLGYLNAERYGTVGGSQNEYKDLLDIFKDFQIRRIDKKRQGDTVEKALLKIDELLGRT